MNGYRFTVVLCPQPEEGGYSVSVPALPGCFTQGETVEEAISMARDAIKLYIEDLLANGEPVPQEETAFQTSVIEVTPEAS
jgi:antitoxin HicB